MSCDFLPGLKTRASYFTDRLVICRISIGSSPQSEGADIQAGIKISIHILSTPIRLRHLLNLPNISGTTPFFFSGDSFIIEIIFAMRALLRA